MSSDFYFRKWKKTLVDLEALVNIDIYFQKTKAHDKKRCKAARRLSGILAQYIIIYNAVWENLDQNLQVQKTTYIHDVLKAVVSRILELKQELQKLEVSEYHFGVNGLVDYKLTPDDKQLAEIPDITERPEGLQKMLEHIFDQVKERKRQLEEEATKKESPVEDKNTNWWEADDFNPSIKEDSFDIAEKEVELSEEQRELKKLVHLIQAQERTRQVIADKTQKYNSRVKWEKSLTGTLAPPAPYEIRKRAAEVIQQVCRAYFNAKRLKHLQCKRHELLDINPCLNPKSEYKEKMEQAKKHRTQLKRKYNELWKTEYENQKEEYLNKRSGEISEDYRNYIRDWFRMWYESILFFNNIPTEKQGGAIMIIKGEVPTPEEWLEEYHAYLADKTANKGKTSFDKKTALLEKKRKEKELKITENMKKKIENELQRKMMKNPTFHPGFYFPNSKRTQHILEVISNYKKDWTELDKMETLDVKERNVRSVDMSNIYMDAKIEVMSTVEEDMRNEFKILKRALVMDYKNAGEKMPTPMMQVCRKENKKKKIKKCLSANIAEKLEDLAFRGYMKEYPYTKIDEFIGDPNFVGDDLRCNYVTAFPHNGEMRSFWWDKCRQLSHGFRRILLVGPRGSGKTTLIHILASLNDAVLFELDPRSIHGLLENSAYLDYLVRSVASCARAVQPSVIHINHVHRLFYRKVPPQDANVHWKLIQRYFIKKLFKLINKADKVTVIGTCVEPWMSKSQLIVKQFPTVVLMPNTSHGTVAQILKDWVLRYTVIPADFDISCLAHALKGYSFGYLQSILGKFMTAETRVRIAARGLSPVEVYDFIIDDAKDGKVDYEKYQKWFYDKTAGGVKEQRHIKDQLEFKQALAEYTRRKEKRIEI